MNYSETPYVTHRGKSKAPVHKRPDPLIAMDYSADLFNKICLNENIQKHQLVLHSDNGGPMKGVTMLATIQRLGVVPSFSRPRVSDDNPYSESLFKTLKYRPNFEEVLSELSDAKKWVLKFADWYNNSSLTVIVA